MANKVGSRREIETEPEWDGRCWTLHSTEKLNVGNGGMLFCSTDGVIQEIDDDCVFVLQGMPPKTITDRRMGGVEAYQLVPEILPGTEVISEAAPTNDKKSTIRVCLINRSVTAFRIFPGDPVARLRPVRLGSQEPGARKRKMLLDEKEAGKKPVTEASLKLKSRREQHKKAAAR